MPVKIVTIVGARPQFIKAAAVSRVIASYGLTQGGELTEIIVHTGQHYDQKMSEIFFKELGVPAPDYNLGVSSLSHGAMTGRMLEKIETVLEEEKPDVVLVYGDTNSTLAGTLAASKMHIPVAHVEAGLRSFNMRMPEEVNRVVADRLSTWLFCPSQAAVAHLRNEGVVKGVHLVGDVMFDVVLHFREKAEQAILLEQWGVEAGNYVLCTIHRAENTDDPARLLSIFSALKDISRQMPVVLPLHPRTLNAIKTLGGQEWLTGLNVCEPLSYLEMIRLTMSSHAVVTDSGGLQKEAFFHRVPCITARDETEWTETVALGWNRVVGADKNKILDAFRQAKNLLPPCGEEPYGDGHAAEQIIEILAKEPV